MFKELGVGVLAAVLCSQSAGAAELRPIQSSGKANGAAVNKIERIIAEGLRQALPTYPASIVIEPIISDLRFESGGKRFWLGPVAGSSHVTVRVRVTQGARVVEQSFHESSGAWKGSWSIGASDNYMLERVAHDVVEYVLQRPWELVATQEGAEDTGSLSRAAGSAPATDGSPASGSATDALYNDLTKLDDLRKRGLITDAEYEVQKKRLLESR